MQTEGLASVIQVLRLWLKIFTTAETPSQAMSDCWRNAGSSSRSKNGSLLYTIIPLQEVMEQHYEQQFNALERTTERRKVQAKLAEQLGA